MRAPPALLPAITVQLLCFMLLDQLLDEHEDSWACVYRMRDACRLLDRGKPPSLQAGTLLLLHAMTVCLPLLTSCMHEVFSVVLLQLLAETPSSLPDEFIDFHLMLVRGEVLVLPSAFSHVYTNFCKHGL
ncbi:hypothetical protein VIGAN_05242100 [Vigna angularis var. angularis]|uniref:Uncharacterized protein n=1 Tax=Vigna angularis var. angularis TaxID=157739 RepID=A0A0S3S7I8_PHAAN|nr:hypothetical protein VIGAN_05242100 [Vigna angularis var. angularis]